MRVVLKPAAIVLLLISIIGLSSYAIYWQSVASTVQKPNSGGFSLPLLGGPTQVAVAVPTVKKRWVEVTSARFTEKSGVQAKVSLTTLESREALQEILNNKAQPVLWMVDNNIWAGRLDQAWREKNGGNTLFELSSITDVRPLAKTPLIFVTTKKKAETLRPYIETATPWQGIYELISDTRKTPWGGLRYTHTDPTQTDIGFMAVGGMLADFAKKSAGGDVASATASPKFVEWLTTMKRGFVSLPEGAVGLVLFNEFTKPNPAFDLLCCYESEAIQALQNNKDLVALYPNPTTVSEVCGVILSKGSWVSTKQREAAGKLMDYLGDTDSIKYVILDRMRPITETKSLSIRNVIFPVEAQGIRADITLTQPPPYEVVNDALVQWNRVMKGK
jgi:hypothetical protein